MLVHAALVPDTALLVPGVAGRHEPAGLADLRAAALAAVAEGVEAARGGRLVVVAPRAGTDDRAPAGRVRAGLGAAGVPDALLGWPVPDLPVVAPPAGVDLPVAGPSVGVPAAVALHLVAAASPADPPADVVVVEVARDAAAPARAADLRALGAACAADAPTALVVVGSGSARHGPHAPLADEPDAPAWDDALHAALAGPGARDALAGLDRGACARLAVSGWAPWQVLVGASAGVPLTARLDAVVLLAGAAHAAGAWATVPA
ncbi:hypothetical protein [Cellulomonas oligotrophica]|uniref:Extradiol ring-cleavage dioxygenase class III enzyme subunit B domain-containing protein n=1 Tax=Cellulomonas oligotrophica TaxID=931536 RepID=A0A7Y9FIV9_9CELL|nr:hypothetical protein [Cellulomonas oligotrophica]NYD88196.1 hypothetical protein [Cellulomonas oligotrophica]GIG33941.1 hypothetical protein Col01nite_31000 [Cellulomonas oligotrophica]